MAKGNAREYRDDAPSDNPEALAMVAAEQASIDRISKLAEEVGLPRRFTDALITRLQRKNMAVHEAVKAHTTKQRIAELEQKHALALSFIDEITLSEASARDLAYVSEMLHRQLQLETGRPTQILSTQERRNINDLIPALIQEAQRRGVTVEVPFEVEEESQCRTPSLPNDDSPELL